MNMKKGINPLSDAYILIKYNNEIPLNNYTTELLRRFMNYMNGMIGLKTSSNYHIKLVKKFTITIPIYVYTNIEKKSDPVTLVENKIKIVRDYLEKMDWKSAGKRQLWIIRSLHIQGIDISNSFTISTVTPNLGFNDLVDDPLVINFPKLEYPKIVREKFVDGSFINYLSDPYLNDYGVFMNLTVPFDEMGMSYNGLHLYEHLMTRGWDSLSGENIVDFNGSTYPHAICYIYNIHSTLNSMKEYAAASILWYLKSRKKGFWEEHKDVINLEIERTISETRKERTLVSMGRSDFHAYDYNYNTEIFEYWSNKPFELLICGPEPIESLKLKTETINKAIEQNMPRKDIKRPENIKFKHIPVDVLKMKKFQGLTIQKIDTKTVKEKILSKDFDTKGALGFDCSFNSKQEDLSVLNSILHPLLFVSRVLNEEELNKFIQTHALPFSSALFSEASIQLKNAALYLTQNKVVDEFDDGDDD